jgi:ABC-type transport system involved in cytochrome c biogenesis permease subunit
MKAERRNTWIGIIIGACFVAAGPFVGYFLLETTTYMFIFFLIGGFIAGIFSQGDVMDGIYSGLKCGFLGGVILAVVIVAAVISSLLKGPLDFIAGMAIFLGLIFVALAALFASAGSVIWVMVRKMALQKS